MLGDFMFQFINPLLDGNIWGALVLILMSFWITICAIITHKKLHTCFNNFIAFDTGIMHNQLLKHWIIQRYTLFCVALRGVFGFCGVTDHINVYLNMWVELRFLYVFAVVIFLIHQLTRYLNSATLLTTISLYLHKLHFLFSSPINHRVSAVLTSLSHLHLVLNKCLQFFLSLLHWYKLEVSTKLHLCTYSTTCSISSFCLHVISNDAFSFLVQTSR